MEEVADPDIKRHPRQIKDRRRPRTAEKRPHLIEIAHRLQTSAPSAYSEGEAHDDVMHAGGKVIMQRAADPKQNAASDRIQYPLRRTEEGLSIQYPSLCRLGKPLTPGSYGFPCWRSRPWQQWSLSLPRGVAPTARSHDAR